MKLMSVTKALDTFFSEKSRPDPRVFRAAIAEGDIPGKWIGKRFYVDGDAFSKLTTTRTKNPLVARVLEH